MTTATKKQSSQLHPKPTTGIIEPTMNDAVGFYEPLTRYSGLPSNYLRAFDPRYDSRSRDRLTDIIKETSRLPEKKKYLHRNLARQWRYGGMNGKAHYYNGEAAYSLLEELEILDQPKRLHAQHTIIGRKDDPHDFYLTLSVASIELATRNVPGVRFINHLEILDRAPRATQNLKRPFSLALPALHHPEYRPLHDTHLEPDALFGLEYSTPDGPAYRFFAVEYDRGTETIVPEEDIEKSSWLHKVLSYNAAAPIFRSQLGLPNVITLAIFGSEPRAKYALKQLTRFMRDRKLFAAQSYRPAKPFETIEDPTARLLCEPWKRAGQTDLYIDRP